MGSWQMEVVIVEDDAVSRQSLPSGYVYALWAAEDAEVVLQPLYYELNPAELMAEKAV